MVEYFEARRYSAVLIQDPRLTTIDTLLSALGLGARAARRVQQSSTELVRATFKSRQPHYPPAVRVVVPGEGNPNQIYLGRTSASHPAPLIVAAPYVKLLGEALHVINAALSGDEPLSYARLDMAELFEHFEMQSHRFIKATQIQVSMKRGGVDKVTLSGDNPLRSDLRRAMLGVAKPSGIRLRSTHSHDARPTNVYMDYDGNLFWHLANEDTWENVAPVLELLTGRFQLAMTTDNPLRKVLAHTPNPPLRGVR